MMFMQYLHRMPRGCNDTLHTAYIEYILTSHVSPCYGHVQEGCRLFTYHRLETVWWTDEKCPFHQVEAGEFKGFDSTRSMNFHGKNDVLGRQLAVV